MIETETFKKKTISAFIYSFGGFIASTGIQFILNIVLARLLLPTDYGLIGMITIFIAVSQIFIDSGMTQALIREKDLTQEDLSTVFYYNLLLSIISYGILFASAYIISDFFREPLLVQIIRVSGLNLIIGAFGLIQRTMLTRQLNFKAQTIIDVISSIISGALAIALAYHSFGVWALVVQTLSKQLIISLSFSLYNRWLPSFVFRLDSFKKLFVFGWKMLVTGILATAYQNFYHVIIGRLYPPQLGYYTKSKQVVDLASTSVTATVIKVSYPALSQIQEDEDRFKASFRKLIKNVSFLTFPMMIGLAVVANPLITVLFGINWTPMTPYFQILCLSEMTYAHRALNLDILKVKGRSDIFLKLDLFKIAIGLIAIVFVVALKLGIFALLWTTFFTAQVAFLVNTHFSKVFIDYSTKEQFKDMLPSLIVSLLMGVIVWLFGTIVPFGTALTLVLQIIVGIVVYFGMSKLARIEEFETLYQLVKSGIRRAINVYKG